MKAPEHTYRVYRQAPPRFVGKDAEGVMQYAANLSVIGVVYAVDGPTALSLARVKYRLSSPVLHRLDARGNEVTYTDDE